MANASSTYGQITFHCDQKTLNHILEVNETWYYCHLDFDFAQDLVPNQALNFCSMGRWNLLANVRTFFRDLTSLGPVTIDWDFHDFEPGLGVFYHAKCTIAYDPLAEDQTQVIELQDTDIEPTAKNLEDGLIVDQAGDLYTDYGLQNLKDYVAIYKADTPLGDWLVNRSIKDIRVFCLAEDLTNPKMGIYMADDVEGLAEYLEDYMVWNRIINWEDVMP